LRWPCSRGSPFCVRELFSSLLSRFPSATGPRSPPPFPLKFVRRRVPEFLVRRARFSPFHTSFPTNRLVLAHETDDGVLFYKIGHSRPSACPCFLIRASFDRSPLGDWTSSPSPNFFADSYFFVSNPCFSASYPVQQLCVLQTFPNMLVFLPTTTRFIPWLYGYFVQRFFFLCANHLFEVSPVGSDSSVQLADKC